MAVQHPGSDDSLLQHGSPLALRRAFKAAMNPERLAERADDLRAVLARLGHDPVLPDIHAPIGLAGHSFGAVTVQILAGERRPTQRVVPLDPRVRAILALSPSARGEGHDLTERFGALERPFFSLTGSRDDGMGLSDITAANRELPFRHMPPGHKYLLVFAGGTHLDFAGQSSPAEQGMFRLRRAPPPFQNALLAASTAFWRAHLLDDSDARHWLESGLPGILRNDDRYARK